MENVNKQQRNFISVSELKYGLLKFSLGGFAYNWQRKWVGIIAIKTERTQNHFLRDVLVAVASLDLKVPIASGAPWFSMDPRRFGSHVTTSPSAQQHTNVKWLNQQVWQRKWNSRFLARNRVATRPYREKKQQQSRVLFRLSFNLYTWRGWTDKELEREIKNKGDEFCWKNNMKLLYRRWEKEKR